MPPKTLLRSGAPADFGDIGDNTNTQRLLVAIGQQLEDLSVLLISDSTGATTSTWFRLMINALVTAWPTHTIRYRDWNTTSYNAPTTVATGTGARTIDFYNAAVASTNTTYPLDGSFDARVAVVQPTVTIISEAHNEGTTSTNRDVVTAAMINLCESVTEACPSTDVILVGQNPETNNSNIDRANQWYRQIAAQRGYSFMSVLEAFRNDPRWAAGTGAGGIMTDTIHPNSLGYQFWATTLAPLFTTRATVRPLGGPAPSTLTATQRNLLVNGDFATYTTTPGAPDNWTAGGSPTVTRDTGTVEDAVKTWSVKVLGSGSAAGEIFQDIDVSRVKGRVVTLVARQYVPTTGSGSTSGIVTIEDSTGSTSTRSQTFGRDGWRWTTVTRRIPVGATTCRIHLYGASSAVAGLAFYDRAALVYGRYPTRAI